MRTLFVFFFFKQKTAYELRISDWSSDVCSSDLHVETCAYAFRAEAPGHMRRHPGVKSHRVPFSTGFLSPGAAVFAAPRSASHSDKDRPRGTPFAGVAPGIYCRVTRSTCRAGGKHAIGSAHVCTPVTNATLVGRLLHERKYKVP